MKLCGLPIKNTPYITTPLIRCRQECLRVIDADLPETFGAKCFMIIKKVLALVGWVFTSLLLLPIALVGRCFKAPSTEVNTADSMAGNSGAKKDENRLLETAKNPLQTHMNNFFSTHLRPRGSAYKALTYISTVAKQGAHKSKINQTWVATISLQPNQPLKYEECPRMDAAGASAAPMNMSHISSIQTLSAEIVKRGLLNADGSDLNCSIILIVPSVESPEMYNVFSKCFGNSFKTSNETINMELNADAVSRADLGRLANMPPQLRNYLTLLYSA